MGKPKGKHTGSRGPAAVKDKATRWTVSTFSKADLNKLRAATDVTMPVKEIVPRPQEDFWVMFTLFLRGPIFVDGVQLHQLTPNSILYIARFVTLCECFLGIDPHWGLWRRIFCIRCIVSQTAVHDVGGAIISTKGPTGYF
jgi:hypothetical protein